MLFSVVLYFGFNGPKRQEVTQYTGAGGNTVTQAVTLDSDASMNTTDTVTIISVA